MEKDATSEELFDRLAFNLQSATELLHQLRQTPTLPQCSSKHQHASSSQEAPEGVMTSNLSLTNSAANFSLTNSALNFSSTNSADVATTLLLPDEICTRSSTTWELHPGWQEDLEMTESIAMTMQRTSIDSGHKSNPSDPGSPQWHPWTFAPTSTFRQWWECIGLLVVFLDVFVAPMETFFDTGPSTRVFDAFIISSNGYWTANIPLRFFFAFYDYMGVPERRLKVIMIRYMQTWFVFDLVMVSLDWVLIVLNDSALHVRMLRMVRLLRASQKITWMQDARSSLGSTIFNNVALLGLLGAYLHLNACAWFSLSDWRDSLSLVGHQDQSVAYRYFTSLNFAVAHFRTTRVPDPESMAMRVYLVIVSLIALIASPLLVGKITTSLVRMESSRNQSRAAREQLRLYLREHAVPNRLNQRIWCFLQNIPATKPLTYSNVDLLEILPASLADNLRLEVLGPLLELHPFFSMLLHSKHMSHAYQCTIVRQCLEELCLSLGSCIFAAGECAQRRMLIIKNGQVDYSDMRISTTTHGTHCTPNCLRELNSVNEVAEVCRKMRKAAFELMPKDRVWLGGSYRSALNARDIISWLVESGCCSNRKEAVQIGLDLQRHDLIAHVWNKMPMWMVPFTDTEMYFRYTERALMLKGSEMLLGPGSWLCEQALWLRYWKHYGTATITSQTYCEILAVDAEKLQKVVAWMPEVQRYARLFVQEGYSSEVGFKSDCELLLEKLKNPSRIHTQPGSGMDDDGTSNPDSCDVVPTTSNPHYTFV